MNTSKLFDTGHGSRAVIVLAICFIILVCAVAVVWMVQRDFGRSAVCKGGNDERCTCLAG